MGRSGIHGGGEDGSAPEGGADGVSDGIAGDGAGAASAGPVPAPATTTAPGGAGKAAGRAAARRAAKPKRPLWRRILVWTAGSVAVIVAGVAVAAYLYIRHLNNNITEAELHLGNDPLERAAPNAEGQTPLNILLLGSDSRDSEENQELGGARDLAGGPVRADVQMLLHVSADRSNITLISIPRDTQVTIPECTDPETGEVYPEETSASINTSLSHGGPGCTVATWEQLTRIPIDHMMMVDFAGVVDMADAVGGVPVCVEQNVYDPDSGLRLEAGETIIQGEQALQWLRTRHGFEGGSDISRTRAQQMYLTNMVEELQSGTSLTDPGELMDLAEAATSALTVDPGLGSVEALYELGQDLRRVPSERINMLTMPWLPDPENPDTTVIPDPERAEELFSLVRQDIPLDDPDARPEREEEPAAEPRPGGDDESAPEDAAPPAAEIPVGVRNGTGSATMPPVNGRATVITEELYRLGYTSAWTDATPAAEASTVILYPSEADRAAAAAVAESLGLPDEAVQQSPGSTGITLIVGADWREGTTYPSGGAEPPDGGSTGDGGDAGDTGDEEDHPSFSSDDIISGRDDDACMPVNPNYTW